MAEAAEAPDLERRRGTKSATAFRTISEVASELEVPPHVLRFWESKFTQVRPLKRGGGRRYYRPEDIELLRSIRELLYTDGYTIKGVQKLLREGGIKALTQGPGAAAEPDKESRAVQRGKKAAQTPAPAQAPAPVAVVEVAPTPVPDAIPPVQSHTESEELTTLRAALEDVLGELEEIRASLRTWID